MVNSYKKGSHFSWRKFREVLCYFSADINATTTADFVNLNRDTVNKIFLEIRKIIAKYCEENSIFESGEIELDESYFGARRVRGNAIKSSRIEREGCEFRYNYRNENIYKILLKLTKKL